MHHPSTALNRPFTSAACTGCALTAATTTASSGGCQAALLCQVYRYPDDRLGPLFLPSAAPRAARTGYSPNRAGQQRLCQKRRGHCRVCREPAGCLMRCWHCAPQRATTRDSFSLATKASRTATCSFIHLVGADLAGVCTVRCPKDRDAVLVRSCSVCATVYEKRACVCVCVSVRE